MASSSRPRPPIFLLHSLLLGVLTALLGLLLCRLPPVLDWEAELGLDWLFQLRGPRPAPGTALVIAIDKATVAALNLPTLPDRWPRRLHAQLVDQLTAAGAAVIVFDMRFVDSRYEADEQLFAEALLRAGNVVLVEDLKQSGTGRYVVDQRIPPLPLLAEAATALAPFPLPKEGRVDRLWLFKRGAGDAAVLPVAALHVYARPHYPRLRELLREIAPAQAARLPAPALLHEPGGINGLMVVLRGLLYDDPALAAALQQRLHTEPEPVRNALTALVTLHSGHGDSYLDFYGQAGSLPVLSYHQALANPAAVAGKVVFIGFFEERYQNRQIDGFRTVFTVDGVDLSGVEIAATVFENLLEGRRVAPLPPFWELVQISVWGLAAGVVFGALSTLRLTLALTALIGTLLGLAWYSFAQGGIWLPLVTNLLVQVPLALFGALLLRSAQGQRMLEGISELLPSAIIDRLARREPMNTLEQRLYGVCLSTDVADYTTLAETMDTSVLLQRLRRYYAPLIAAVRQHQGRVSDILGDGMLAIWEGTTTQPDPQLVQHASQALFTALRQLNERRQAQPDAWLLTRFGLHGGDLTVGALGATGHYEYRPIGDAVNTATRIQSFNKTLGTQVLASAEVVPMLQGVRYRELGRFRLKGKEQPVTLYELLGPDSEQTPDEREQHRQFAAALALFRAEDWSAAQQRFERLTSRYSDGPALYYSRLCAAYAEQPPAADWDGVVVVEQK